MNVKAIFGRVASAALRTGRFARVQTHETKTSPGAELVMDIFLTGLRGINASSLAATSVRMELTGRIYKPFLSDPQDDIDAEVTDAGIAVFTELAADFELGGEVRNIDIRGAYGSPLDLRAGYITIGSTVHRTADLIIPMIINDVLPEVP